MGDTVAEHGKTLPDDETAERRSQKRNTEPGKAGAQ
jgi:hypothetical protein